MHGIASYALCSVKILDFGRKMTIQYYKVRKTCKLSRFGGVSFVETDEIRTGEAYRGGGN